MMSYRPWALAPALVLLVIALCPGQVTTGTLPFPNYGTTPGTFPFNSTFLFQSATAAGDRHLFAIDTGLFDHQGAMRITDLSIRRDNNGATPAFGYPSVGVQMGTSALPVNMVAPPASSLYGPDLTLVRPAAPWAGGPFAPGAGSVAPWVSLGLTMPFDFVTGPGNILLIEIWQCGVPTTPFGLVDGFAAAQGIGNRWRQLKTNGLCSWSASGFGTSFCVCEIPVFNITYTPLEPWETNDGFCSLDIDGRTNTGFSGPIERSMCVGQTAAVNFNSSLNGNPWDLGITPTPPVPAFLGDGFALPSGQRVNLNLTMPPPLFLNGFPGGPLPPFPAGGLTFAITPAAPVDNSAQGLVLDATHPDGLHLSAPCRLTAGAPAPLAAVAPGPTGYYTSTVVPVGCFEFFGTAYTEISVTSGGNIVFGSPGGASFSANCPSCLPGDPPMVGLVMDLDPGVSGTISTSSPTPTTIRVDYTGVAFLYDPGVTATFSVELDLTTGSIEIDNLTAIASGPLMSGADDIILCISPGQPAGATLPGPVTFNLTGPNPPASATDVIYSATTIGALFPGLNSLLFQPTTVLGAPTYSWTGSL